MTIKQLKERLNEFDEDTIVEVQYRDGGGSYYGHEEPWVELSDGILFL